MIKFTWKESIGEGTIKVTDKFEDMHPVDKLDFIQDALYLLKQLQIVVHNEVYSKKEG